MGQVSLNSNGESNPTTVFTSPVSIPTTATLWYFLNVGVEKEMVQKFGKCLFPFFLQEVGERVKPPLMSIWPPTHSDEGDHKQDGIP